jgi:adenine-specific DNA-methyltransferase
MLNVFTTPLTEESIKRYYTLKDQNFSVRGPYRTHPLEATKSMGERKNLVYGIPGPDGKEIQPKRQWLWSQDRALEAAKNGELEFLKSKDGTFSVHTKQYLRDENGVMREGKPFSLIDDVYTQHGTNEIIDIFGNAQIFSFPKPSEFVRKLVEIGTSGKGEEIILDFFAGSGTTAHAVVKANNQDGGNRRFILVQIPEECDPSSEAYKAGYKKISDVTKERVRRISIEQTNDLLSIGSQSGVDQGFRVLKIDSSNMAEVYYNPDVVSQDLLSEQEDNVRSDRTSEDLLFQVLLDWGVDLSLPISSETIQGKSAFFVDENALVACFDNKGGIDEDFVKELAKRQPLRVVFRDAGFKSDSVKINVEQIFKLLSPSTEVKCI